jgi:transcriptional regulator with XRE-family HTH domain
MGAFRLWRCTLLRSMAVIVKGTIWTSGLEQFGTGASVLARITLTQEDRQRIRELRAAAGLSRPELAEKMRVTEKTIRNIESESSGRATFNDYTIECLARALGTTVSEIVVANGKENEEPMLATGHAGGPDDADLLQVYRGTTPLSVSIAGAIYTVPVELVVPAPCVPNPCAEVQLRLVPGTFVIPEQIDPYTAPIRQRLHEEARRNTRLFDGKVLRLCALKQQGSNWAGEIQRASYFDALATNFHGLDTKPETELTDSQGATFRAKSSVGGSGEEPPGESLGLRLPDRIRRRKADRSRAKLRSGQSQKHTLRLRNRRRRFPGCHAGKTRRSRSSPRSCQSDWLAGNRTRARNRGRGVRSSLGSCASSNGVGSRSSTASRALRSRPRESRPPRPCMPRSATRAAPSISFRWTPPIFTATNPHPVKPSRSG